MLDTRLLRLCDGSSCPPIRLAAAVRWWSEAGGVVPGFDPPADRQAGLGSAVVVGAVDELLLEGAEERLGGGVDAPIVKYWLRGWG